MIYAPYFDYLTKLNVSKFHNISISSGHIILEAYSTKVDIKLFEAQHPDIVKDLTKPGQIISKKIVYHYTTKIAFVPKFAEILTKINITIIIDYSKE